jgi:small subunit ribosomal protein S7
MEQKKIVKMHNFFNFKYIILSFVRILQKNGSKESSELTLKSALSIIKKNSKKEPLIFFKEIIHKSKPFCEVKSIRISGTNYKVPVEIKSRRQKVLALKWIILNSSGKLESSLANCLAKEFIDTYNLTSKTIKMCDDFHKIAESNKIYMQFRN